MSKWTHKIHIGTRRISLKKTMKIGRIFDDDNNQLTIVESATFSGLKRLLRQTGLVPSNLIIEKKDTFFTI